MANNASYVSAGKPKVSGAIFIAPKGTTLPTNATADLAATYKCLGYVSEDGLVNSNSPESENIKAWGGDTVLSIQTAKDDIFTFTLCEVLNIEVLKAIYGGDNVSGALATGLTVTANSAQAAENVWVIDMILKGNHLKRIVIPCAVISELGDIEYTDEAAIGYPVTLTCIPDTNGNTHYEYIQQQS